ncbi:MAG: hypothetical protein ABFS03_13630 [Chloroflexota bacterium]
MAKKKKMMVSFVLDETGSMQSVKGETISGFNEYIQTLNNEKSAENIRFTLTKFNSMKVEVVYDSVKLGKVAALDDDSYRPEAMTPLYDAIGKTIRSLEDKLEGKKPKALVVIQTDGHENHSKEFNRKSIFSLIDEKKKAGWTFAFLGADQDAWLAGQELGIPKGNTMSYRSAETKNAFNLVARSSISYVISGGDQTEAFFSDQDKKPTKKAKK